MESRESRASQASGVALRAPRAGRGSGVKGRLRLRPSRPLPTLPADLCQRAIRKPRRIHETLPAAASGHIPLELTTPQRERDSSDAGTLFSPFWETPPRRCLRPAPLKGSPCTFSDSGFPSDSGKPGKHPDLFAFYFTWDFTHSCHPQTRTICFFLSNPCALFFSLLPTPCPLPRYVE